MDNFESRNLLGFDVRYGAEQTLWSGATTAANSKWDCGPDCVDTLAVTPSTTGAGASNSQRSGSVAVSPLQGIGWPSVPITCVKLEPLWLMTMPPSHFWLPSSR